MRPPGPPPPPPPPGRPAPHRDHPNPGRRETTRGNLALLVEILRVILVVSLILSSGYAGVVEHDYARASHELLLALLVGHDSEHKR